MVLKHILVALDGSPLAETILPFAKMLAERLAAKVTLLNVTHVPRDIRPVDGQPSVDEVVHWNTARAEQYLHDQERALREAGIAVGSAVAVGNPANEIVEYARQADIDLIALATHGRSGLQRWVRGSVADEVLHISTTPLLLMRPDEGWIAAPHDLQQIVVPLDGSPLAEAALPIAELIAARLGVTLVLLRVIEPLGLAFVPDPMGAAYIDYQAIIDSLRSGAQEYLETISARLRVKKLGVDTIVSIGMVAETARAYVHEHSGSLLVLTTHGRSGVRRLLLGSVARQILNTAGAPAIAIRPKQDDTGENGK